MDKFIIWIFEIGISVTDEICEGEVVHSKHLEDIASDMEG